MQNRPNDEEGCVATSLQSKSRSRELSLTIFQNAKIKSKAMHPVLDMRSEVISPVKVSSDDAHSGLIPATAAVGLKEAPALHKTKTSRRRRVRFVKDQPDVFYRGDNHLNVCPTILWYGPEEFQSFKEKLVKDGKKMARTCKSEDVLHRVFQKCLDNEKVNDKLFAELSDFLCDPRVNGLERFVSKVVYSDRRQRRLDMEHIVFERDFEGEEQRRAHPNPRSVDHDIRRELKRKSRPSTIFAGLIAIAGASLSLSEEDKQQ